MVRVSGWGSGSVCLTALDENVQALLDQQRGVEDDEPVAERQDIVARSHLEEGTNRTLSDRTLANIVSAS